MNKRTLLLLTSAALIIVLTACTEIGYYLQSAKGQIEIMASRDTVESLLNDDATPEKLRQQLLLAGEILDFARSDMLLNNDGSYEHYVDIERPHVVWNVVATPALSLSPETWCFPFAGCVPYRGYFEEENARRFAADLKAEGLDVFVYGVPAYSTLGWFDDPLLNTFIFEKDFLLASMILHELAHKKLYVKDHTDFNEAFAVVVARKGVERWLNAQASSSLDDFRTFLGHQETYFDLLQNSRQKLSETYGSSLSDSEKLREKARIIGAFRQGFQEMVAGWGGTINGTWLENGEINNANFASAHTYRKLVPALEALWSQSGEEPQRFFDQVNQLADLSIEERLERLEVLQP